MSTIAYILLLAFSGLVIGAPARLTLPGRDPMSVPQTMLRKLRRRQTDRGGLANH